MKNNLLEEIAVIEKHDPSELVLKRGHLSLLSEKILVYQFWKSPFIIRLNWCLFQVAIHFLALLSSIQICLML